MPGLVDIWAEFSKKKHTGSTSTCRGEMKASQGGEDDGKKGKTNNVLVKVRRSSTGKLSESEATMCMLLDRFAPS